MYRFANYLVLIFMLLISSVATPQIPRTLSYQGILTDNTGSPRPDKDYQFTFCLYDTTTGGTPLWSEQKTLPVKNGLFSTVLGDHKPFGVTVKFDKQYWLGIQIGSEAELAPRVQLASVGYSMNAVRADTAKVALGSNFTNMLNIVGTTNATLRFQTTQNPSDYYWQSASDGSHYLYDGRAMAYRLFIKSNGYIGIGTLPQRRLHIKGNDNEDLLMFGNGNLPGETCAGFRMNNAGNGTLELNVSKSGVGFGNIGIASAGGRVGIGTANPTATFEVVGRTKTQILEITGGSDLAEPFELSHTDSIPVGSLVVIDPENPGKLKQATEPYDKRVAGVISGAGGINPGLTLTQQGKLEGSQHVALTGKVYALATTTNGTIEPGDLLTTSDVPGHAMKATDHEHAFGAVIGKAMSGLKEDKGLVLVLIQPH